MEEAISLSDRAITKKAEKLLYILAVALTPSIPLYFLYSQNATEGLDFNHFLIFGTALAAISLIAYFPVSKFYLHRRRAVFAIASFWFLFWAFPSLHSAFNIIFDPDIGKTNFGIGLMLLVIIVAFTLRRVPVNRLLANATAVMLCVLFALNFVPVALTVSASNAQRAEIEKSGELPFEIKADFRIDPDLPSPNIYWLHMDGMMGFSGVEYFFGDPQTELKQELAERGFVINERAQLEAGFTQIAIPIMLSPVAFDSFLSSELAAFSHLVRDPKREALYASFSEIGVTYDDFYSRIELLKAFSDADYLTLSRRFSQSESMDILVQSESFIHLTTSYNEAINANRIEEDFEDLICGASALSIFEKQIDDYMDARRSGMIEPILKQVSQPIPEYTEIVSKYVTDSSNSDTNMALMLRQLKHASTFASPLIYYHINDTAHVKGVNSTTIGGIEYGEIIGCTYIYDENGNVYTERLEDVYDLNLYLPNHKYAVKEMLAQIDTIIGDNPNAVIILQGDHGIHGFGPPGGGYFNSDFLLERGYSIEDQMFMNHSVISAVRVPPQYGHLAEPLDPLDISRWLVNSFVGDGNYEYLYYEQWDIPK